MRRRQTLLVLTLFLAVGFLRGCVHELRAETRTVTVVPASNTRQLTASNSIVLLSPPDNSPLYAPMTFSWQAGSQFHSYKILFFDDIATLQAYKAAQGNSSSQQATAPGNEVCTGTGKNRTCTSAPPQPEAAPFFTDTASSPTHTIAENQIGSCDSRHPNKCKTFITGELVAWMVMGTDTNGNVAFSEARSVALEPTLDSLNGLPKYLDIGGFRVYVNSYQAGVSADNFSGQGWTVFRREGTFDPAIGAVNSRTQIPLSFQTLKGDVQKELVHIAMMHLAKRQVPIVQAVLKANITSGDIRTKFSPAVGLTFNLRAKEGWDYKIDLKLLWLKSAPSGAVADLTMHVPHVATDGGEQTVALDNTSLEPGGDFYREVDGSQLPTIYLGATQGLPPIGTISHAGKLVVAFSESTTYPGGPLPDDTFVVLANGTVVIDATSLFPMSDAASITTSYTTLYLSPRGPYGKLKVEHSTPIHPVVPAGYELAFTDGAMSVHAGSMDLIELPEPSFDGNVKFPSKVRSAGGLAASGTFQGLKPAGSSYTANLQLGQIEWGSGDKPFRLLHAGGTLVVSTSGDPSAGGITITQGYLESPFEVAPPGAKTTRSTSSGATGASGSAAGGDSYSDNVNLTLHLSGVSGTMTSGKVAYQVDNRPAASAEQKAITPSGDKAANQSTNASVASKKAGGLAENVAPPRTTMIGDFHADIGNFALEFTDGTVTSSSIDGQLVVPKPADFTVDFTGASLTSTGDLLGVSLLTPSSVTLAYWHAQILFPTTTSAASARAVTAQPAQTETKATSKATSSGGANIGNFTQVALALSTSYLQVNSGTLQLLVDPQFGGNEFDAFSINTLQIGADGQIQAAQVYQSSKFLGMDFQLDSADLEFSAGNSEAPVGTQPLVTLAGQLAFPSFGQKHVIVQHTASGADVTEISPADLHRGNDSTMKTSAKVQWVNGYAKGITDKDGNGFKEFIGLAQVGIVKMLYLNGVIMIGEDQQGTYDITALGVGVDVNKAYALYSGGWVGVGAKLGAAATDYISNGKSTQADNVANLVGDIAKLKNNFNADAVINTVADAVKLAEGIYVDTNPGKKDDEVDVSLKLAGVGLQLAKSVADLRGKTADPTAPTLAILKGLDAAMPILEKAAFIDKDTMKVLRFIHLGVIATRVVMEKGDFTEADFVAMNKELLALAKALSVDPNYVLAIDTVIAVVDLATSKDEWAALQMGSSILAGVNKSGVFSGPDAKNVLVIAQGLLDGAAKTKGMPEPDNFVSLGASLLDAASSGDANYGKNDKLVKIVLKLGKTTLQAVAQQFSNIDYDKASKMVQATFNDNNPPAGPGSPGEQVKNLLDVWTSIKTNSLTASLDALNSKFVCPNQVGSNACVGSVQAAVNQAVQAVDAAAAGMNPGELMPWPLQGLAAIKKQAEENGKAAEFNSAFDPKKPDVEGESRNAVKKAIDKLKNATSPEDSASAEKDYKGTDDARDRLGLPTDYRNDAQAAEDANLQKASDDAVALINQAQTPEDMEKAAAGYLGRVRARALTVDDPSFPGSDKFWNAYQQKTVQFANNLTAELSQTTDFEEAKDKTNRILKLTRRYLMLGGDASKAPSLGTVLTAAQPAMKAQQQRLSDRVANTSTPEDFKKAAQDLINFRLEAARQAQLLGMTDSLPPLGNYDTKCIDLEHTELAASMTADSSQSLPHEKNIINAIAPACKALSLVNDILSASTKSELNSAPGALRSGAALETFGGGVKAALPITASVVHRLHLFAQAGNLSTECKGTVEQWYSDAVNNLPSAKTLDDAAAGFWLYTRVYTTSLGTDLGCSDLWKQQHADTLKPLLLAQAPVVMDDALAKIKSASADQLADLISKYRAWAQFSGASTQGLNDVASNWATKASQAPCSQQDKLVDQLGSPALAIVPSANAGANQGVVNDLLRRCGSPDGAVAQEVKDYAAALAKDSGALQDMISRLRDSLQKGANEDGLKEELAWLIAVYISDLTAPFAGTTDEEAALWAVHKQADFVVNYKNKSRKELISGAVDIVATTLDDLWPNAKTPIGKAVSGLKKFINNSDQQTTFYGKVLLMIASMSDAFLPPGKPHDIVVGSLIGVGLRNAGPVGGSIVLATLGGVSAGIAVAWSKEVKKSSDGDIDYAATLAQLDNGGKDFWGTIGKDINDVVKLIGPISKLQGLFSALISDKKSPADRLQRLQDIFADDTIKKSKVGKFVAVLSAPDNSLFKPDQKHDNYASNLLLAELDTARGSLPNGGPDGVGFKSTCPTLDVNRGLVGGQLSGNGGLFCAIDLARDLINSSMAGVVDDPNSPEYKDAIAGKAVDEMKKDAVYNKAIGDDNLSGIYGAVTYRNGQFREFKLVAAFTVKGFLEAAMKAQWDDGQSQFTLEYEASDERPGSALSSVGLFGGNGQKVNRLFDNKIDIGSPIKTFFLQVAPKTITGTIALSVNTPFGGYETGEEHLAIGTDPFFFDVSATASLSYIPILYTLKPSIELSYQNGNGGLQVGALLTVEPPAVVPSGGVAWPGHDSHGRQGTYVQWGGAYASASLTASFTAGSSGVNTGGNLDAQGGVYQTEIAQPDCSDPGFEPVGTYWDSGQKDGNQNEIYVQYGNCHYGLDQQFDVLSKIDSKGFFLKGKTSVSILGLASLGIWVYGGNHGLDAGTGDFPSDKYGGWSSGGGGGQ